jgi:hypothetical protein
MPDIFILNFVPTHCPRCGAPLNLHGHEMQEFYSGCSHSCSCGVHFQYTPTKCLVKLVKETSGDMLNYIEVEE